MDKSTQNSNKSFYKPILFILIVIILNVCAVIITSYLYSYSGSEEKRAKDFLSNNRISEKDLGGMTFEYESEYQFKNGEIKSINGNEEYYWNGNKFITVSDYMKGYGE